MSTRTPPKSSPKQSTPPPADAASLRVSRLSARNFKRIEAIALNLRERVMAIVKGPNRSGKTSIAVDALEAALCGKRAVPAEAVRRGAKKGEVTLDLAEGVRDRYRVVRRFTPKDSYLEVTDLRDNSPVTSPQDFLDGLVGDLSFNPLAPLTVETLLGALGLGDTYARIQVERQRAFDARRDANRDVKAAKAQADAKPDPEPTKKLTPIAADTLVTRLREITDANAKIDTADREIETAEETIRKLEGELVAAKKSHVEWSAYRKSLGVKQDNADLDAEANRARVHNARATAQAEARRLAAALTQAEATAASLDDKVKAAEARGKKLLADALAKHDGLAGLSLDDEGRLLLNDLPLDQASGMERIRLGVAVGMAQNPRLKLFAVDDLDKLDAEALAELVRLADEHDALVIGTCVWGGGEDGDDARKLVVQIREGRALGDVDAEDPTDDTIDAADDEWLGA